MQHDTSSFWADIKKFEDTLAKDPASYCFAPLAELYRKTGLLDDAIATAEKGVALHPQYVGGHMALGRAYLDKEMRAEAREALQRVVTFTPENMLAQKLLCQIYAESGENLLLRKTLETLLSLNAADAESRMMLESLDRVAAEEVDSLPSVSASDVATVPVLSIDLLDNADEELEEIDLLDELEELEPDSTSEDSAYSPECDDAGDHPEAEPETTTDSPFGIRTATIADLYAAQGHHEQALNIYRELRKIAPDNSEYEARIEELSGSITALETQPMQLENTWSPVPQHQEQHAAPDEAVYALTPEPEPAAVHPDDAAIDVLQGWLDTIRRVKECRSGRN